MSTIYLAEHELLNRPTALKLIKPEKEDEKTLARFELEAQSISRLSHPNTIQLYDFGKTSNGAFLLCNGVH